MKTFKEGLGLGPYEARESRWSIPPEFRDPLDQDDRQRAQKALDGDGVVCPLPGMASASLATWRLDMHASWSSRYSRRSSRRMTSSY